MKIKYYYIIPVVIIGLTSFIGGLTGAFKIYKLGSTSMEPRYTSGDYIIGTNVILPELNDIIYFKSESLKIPGVREAKTELKVGRLVGLGNDKIELKDGKCYRNGEMIDREEDLKFAYETSIALFKKSGIEKEIVSTDFITNSYMEKAILFLDNLKYERYKEELMLEKINMEFGAFLEESPIMNQIEKTWTWLNYGPIEVPEGHFFYLGDNRMNAEDSRILGSIPIENIRGVVIN